MDGLTIPAAVKFGPDGRLWFTYVPDPGVGTNYLGAITTAGTETDCGLDPFAV